MDHETYIRTIADYAIKCLPDDARAILAPAKIVYGRGQPGLRGITCYSEWHRDGAVPLVEICAAGESDRIQLAGTTLHELGHVLAGFGAGHARAWHDACEKIGLRHCKAAGYTYHLASFRPDVRHLIDSLPPLSDGRPNGWDISPVTGLAMPPAPKPCSAGIGTRGGKSRGAGSGSRMRKFVCDCNPPVIVRAARDELHAHCDDCGSPFCRA